VTVDQEILKIKHEYDFIIIDPPNEIYGTAALHLVSAIIRACDLIIIPIPVVEIDLWGTDELYKMIMERIRYTEGRLKAAFMFARTIKESEDDRQRKEKIASFGLPVMDSYTAERKVYKNTIGQGSTVVAKSIDKKAYDEVMAIKDEVLRMLA
jgi:cellulose biosynthesis protein BcsQ